MVQVETSIGDIQISLNDIKSLQDYIRANHDPGDRLDSNTIASALGIKEAIVIAILENRGQAICTAGLTGSGKIVRIYKAPGDRSYEEARPLGEYQGGDESLFRYASQNRPRGRYQPKDDPDHRWS